ncbi:MAG: 2-succinyl-5-enolpyruvyl-6-hydroxy-3-cyclohexene-1-carboxylic-acid synthase [Lutibacter sp.]|jgi:2-succinyl-5-enolpyruvyl-6-hydroxy-3-cyclohexene-1-carboxylate synthase|nr:2-succinyl-5-enolpyruvyl-6-hydroxy-3-cyclohexene-1-carboxylic-acid synthase [Lutibacter sp.]
MPQFPKNETAQLLIACCSAHSIDHVVISPGSRNAPLIIGFTNHPEIETFSIVDERSAAFFALGMARELGKPVALVCTSGSALLNYYPAVAEAFYTQVPLLVISADRPAHLIDIGDGQTIRQKNIFQDHIHGATHLSEDVDRQEHLASIHRAIRMAYKASGPVHINCPFEEPLYETTEQLLSVDLPVETPKPLESVPDSLEDYAALWNASTKKMVLVGQHGPSEDLQQLLETLVADPSVLVLVENTANVSHPRFINSIDKLIFPLEAFQLPAFQPDILLSLGGLVVSKKIKQHLRSYQPRHHWHVGEDRAFDTFLCLEKHFKLRVTVFFEAFCRLLKPVDSTYQSYWMDKKQLRLQRHAAFLTDCDFTDLKVFEQLLPSIPEHSQLQLSNSAVIRYSQLFDIHDSLQVCCNRGTSGIEGSTSTAIGAAVVRKGPTVLISGDLSFFYDSNACWNTYIPADFRIVVVNNGGGGIFRFIPGPQQTNALDHFETPHMLTAAPLCQLHGLEYLSARNLNELTSALSQFYTPSTAPRLLEVFTPREKNDQVLKAYFSHLKTT